MAHKDKSKKETDRHLDRSLNETFPASDPVAPKHITGTEPPLSDPGRKAPKLSASEVDAAAVETEECPRCHGSGRVVASS